MSANRRRQTNQGRPAIPKSTRRRIRQRLRQWKEERQRANPERYGAAGQRGEWVALARRLGLKRNTVQTWFVESKELPVPDLFYVLLLADDAGERLSPNWLLLGRGPRLLSTVSPDEPIADALLREVAGTISRDQGVSRGAVMRHLPSAQEVLAEVLSVYGSRVRRALARDRKRAAREVVEDEDRRTMLDALALVEEFIDPSELGSLRDRLLDGLSRTREARADEARRTADIVDQAVAEAISPKNGEQPPDQRRGRPVL